jgi:hypothetical protein
LITFTADDFLTSFAFEVWSIIPLGPDEPFMTGAFEYLQRAVVWCRDIGLAVVSRNSV